jgi:Ca-activated chloride channel family protein
MPRYFFCFGLTLCLLLSSRFCGAQGVLINQAHQPTPLPRHLVSPHLTATSSYKIKELDIRARIQDQITRVSLTQTFVNTGSTTMEVSFCFPLPYDGAIDQMTFMVDGKEYQAKLLPADKAREIYLAHVRRNEDPALLEWLGKGMFQTSIFPVPPGAERKVTIQFSQLLRTFDQLTDFLYPLSTAQYTDQPIESFTLQAGIESKSKIKNVYSPTHTIQVERPNEYSAQVALSLKNIIPATDFRLMFDTGDQPLGTSLISYRPAPSQDGYFLLLAAPQLRGDSAQPAAKTVIFVIDRSGSMSGKKMEQAREALRSVLNSLNPNDLFNIVAYDHRVESFRTELQRFDEQSRQAALGYVNNIFAGGSTNISGALTTALNMIQDSDSPSYLLFLTDGLPTSGETNEMKIAQLVSQANTKRTRIISFGVGYDVNSRLLDRLSRDNYGQSEFVRPDEDIEMVVSRLYRRMSSPVLMDAELLITLANTDIKTNALINRVYPRRINDLFAGQQLVVVGRYRQSGQASISIAGTVAGAPVNFEFSGELIESSNDQTSAFVETLWAVRRIGEIIDELDLNGKNDELISELVELSTKYGIMTAYTSFLADETTPVEQLSDSSANLRRAESNLAERLSIAEGRSGFDQRAAKKSYREATQAAPGGGFYSFTPASPSSASVANRAGTVAMDSAMPMDAASQESPVINIENQTLYRRGNMWIAENSRDIDLSRDHVRVKTIDRFSTEYFQLVAENDATENAIFSRQQIGQELLIQLRGQHYHIR